MDSEVKYIYSENTGRKRQRDEDIFLTENIGGLER